MGNDPFWRLEERRQRRRIAKRPFATLWPSIRSIGDDAFWASNCYPVDSGTWLNLWDDGKPYESPLWYAHQLERMYENAKKQASTGNVEGAMWHAFRAGELQAELNLTLAHGRKFEKYDAVNRAQRDAAKARKSVPDETRRDVYWKYRKAGHKKIEAGRQAAKELGLSEPSIRNAFPGARYPAE